MDSQQLTVDAEEDDSPASSHADQLREVTGLALKRARAILMLEPKPEEKFFARIISTQGSLAQGIIAAQIKVESGNFRRRTKDRLEELLERIKKEEAHLLPSRARDITAAAEQIVDDDGGDDE